MDNFKEILNNIKDRFSNPLFFSFGCSWLVINWQITIALFWHDTKQIENTGCNSIFEFIAEKININDTLFTPLVFALIYTFLMPTIKNIIRAFYTWTEKWGENWNLQILKGGKISIDRYFQFREEYDKRTKILEDVIAKENEIATKFSEVNTKFLESQSRINDLSQQVTENDQFIENLYNVKILNGYWTNTYKDNTQPLHEGFEEIFIQDGKYFIIETLGNKKHKFDITNFYYDTKLKRVFFIKELILGTTVYPIDFIKSNIVFLTIEREDLLNGYENGTTKIEYRKKNIALPQPAK